MFNLNNKIKWKCWVHSSEHIFITFNTDYKLLNNLNEIPPILKKKMIFFLINCSFKLIFLVNFKRYSVLVPIVHVWLENDFAFAIIIFELAVFRRLPTTYCHHHLSPC